MSDGGPAFPGQDVVQNMYGDVAPVFYPGMSLRDWFAGMASDQDITEHRVTHAEGITFTVSREVARYRYADAMLKAREAHDA